MPSPASPSEVPPKRTRRLFTPVSATLAVLNAGGVTGCALWPGPVGGGDAVDLRVGDGEDAVASEDMDQVAEILRQRIAGMGQGRPVVTPGDGTVTVELPPDVDAAGAIDLMEWPGVVTIHRVVEGAAGRSKPRVVSR